MFAFWVDIHSTGKLHCEQERKKGHYDQRGIIQTLAIDKAVNSQLGSEKWILEFIADFWEHQPNVLWLQRSIKG